MIIIMLTYVIHLLQYCFQCQLIHIYSKIALKASFTMLIIPVASSRDGISPSVPDNESVCTLSGTPAASGLHVRGKGWDNQFNLLIVIETTTH